MINYKDKVAKKNYIDNSIINLNIYSFANEAKAVAPLNTILGLYNVSLIDFCKKFDNLTQNYINGLKIPAKLNKKIKSKEYNLILKQINLTTLIEIFLSYSYNTDNKEKVDLINYIDIEILFDLIKLYSNLYNLNLIVSSKLVLSKLSCYKNIKQIV